MLFCRLYVASLNWSVFSVCCLVFYNVVSTVLSLENKNAPHMGHQPRFTRSLRLQLHSHCTPILILHLSTKKRNAPPINNVRPAAGAAHKHHRKNQPGSRLTEERARLRQIAKVKRLRLPARSRRTEGAPVEERWCWVGGGLHHRRLLLRSAIFHNQLEGRRPGAEVKFCKIL